MTSAPENAQIQHPHDRAGPRWAHIARTVGVLALLQIPFGRLLGGTGFDAEIRDELIYWALTLGLILYVRFVERGSMVSVGWRRPTWKSAVFGLGAGALTFAGFVVIYLWVFPALGQKAEESGLENILRLPLWFRIALLFRAAIFEELAYRGFAIERLTELCRSRGFAALLSLAAFTFAHLSYWGWAHLLVAAWGGLVLTGLYLWRRDLASNMFAHFVTDLVGFLAA